MMETFAIYSKLMQMKSEIDVSLVKTFPKKNKLSEAICYSLQGEGKRVRPMIVYVVAEALGHGLNVNEVAQASEFFHTASLIADDLPCMDNDDFRRSKPSLHKVFGETTALLASYALISEAFRKIYQNGETMKQGKEPFSSNAEKATLIALECASRCSGVEGATLGQFIDLFPGSQSLEEVERVIYLKTIALFEGSFVMGWVFGGGEVEKLDSVKKLAFHFGMAFQIRDDISDMEQDAKKKQHVNMALAIGEHAARKRFSKELNRAERLLHELNLHGPLFQTILTRSFQQGG